MLDRSAVVLLKSHPKFRDFKFKVAVYPFPRYFLSQNTPFYRLLFGIFDQQMD